MLRLHPLQLHLLWRCLLAVAHLWKRTAAGSASGGCLPGRPGGARSAGDLSGAAAAAAGAAGGAAGGLAGGGVAAQEQQGAEGVARCAFESATRLDSLDVHSLQLEANLARIAHESAARDRQMSQVEPYSPPYLRSQRSSTAARARRCLRELPLLASTSTAYYYQWLLRGRSLPTTCCTLLTADCTLLTTYQVVQLLEHIASSQDLSQIQSQDTLPRQPPQPQPAPNNTPVAVPPRPAATTHGDPTDML